MDAGGYIMTNEHVVAGARRVQVVSIGRRHQGKTRELVAEDGETVDAQVIGVAPEIDLALLKIKATGLNALHMAGERQDPQDELVFAFGSPEGLFNSVTMGVVSAVARQPIRTSVLSRPTRRSIRATAAGRSSTSTASSSD